MIRKVLTYYAEQLEEFLKDKFPQPEGVVELSFIGNSSEGKKNKLLISLVGIERECSIGIASARNKSFAGGAAGAPVLNMNLNIILAAVYDEKRYSESLSVLSDTLLFLQSMPSFSYNRANYIIEVISPSSEELNNTWTSLGGQYYPSVMCKLRGVIFDAGEIRRTSRGVANPIVDM